MTEKQLQHKIVMWFSQQYPKYRGLLFEVNNDTYNIKHASTRLAMGMISGVSDLIFIVPSTGTVFGIELKAPGSRHTKKHIANQLQWGQKVIENGGYYIMSSDIEFIQSLIALSIGGYGIRVRDAVSSELKRINSIVSEKTNTAVTIVF